MLFISSMVSASNTRVMTMGDNNNILLDEANIWLYPSRINEYPDIAVAEFGDADGFYQLGVNWKFNKDNPWVLGTYFSGAETYPYGIPDFDLDNMLPMNRMDLFYGRKIGNNNFGMHLNLWHASSEYEATNDKESFSKFDFTFGLTEETGLWDVALNVALGSWTNEAASTPENEPDGFYTFGAQGRYFMQQGPDYTWIVHAGMMYDKFGVKYAADETEKVTEMILDAGIGLNYTPSNNVLAVIDFGLMLDKAKFEAESGGTTTETKFDNTVLPYMKLGVDADVLKWLDARFGATSYWNNEKYEDAADTDKYKYAQNDLYLGFGFHFGRLHIDTYANPDLFVEGFNFISGGSEQMNYEISAVYEF